MQIKSLIERLKNPEHRRTIAAPIAPVYRYEY